jgi:hypothetical protein
MPTTVVSGPAELLGRVVDPCYDCLRRGLRVNRALAHAWVAAMTGEFDAGRAQFGAVVDALGGHGEAIEIWWSDQAEAVKRSLNPGARGSTRDFRT